MVHTALLSGSSALEAMRTTSGPATACYSKPLYQRACFAAAGRGVSCMRS